MIAAVRGSARYDIPVFAKLSPDVTDIVAMASACVASGADGLSLINTLLGMVIDPVTMRPVLAGRYRRPVRPGHQAGSGAVRLAGAGGAPGRADHRDGRRAYRPGRPGAAARGRVDDRGGHDDLHDPSACSRVLRELEEELAALGVDRAADVIGLAHGSHGRFSRGTARPA